MITLSLPKKDMLSSRHGLMSDLNHLLDLEALFKQSTESLDSNTLDMVRDSAIQLANKYDEKFIFLNDIKFDLESADNMMDVESETLDRVKLKIMSGLSKVRDGISDFGKRLTIALKAKPTSGLMSKLNDLPVKSVILDKREMGFINRSMNAYSKSRDITTLKGLINQLKSEDIKKQVDEITKVITFLSTFEVGDKKDKDIKEEFLKACVTNDIDKITSKVIEGKDFKIPKAIYAVKNDIKNGDVKFIASSCYNNVYAFIAVGMIKKNIVQKIMSIKDYSDSFQINAVDNSYKITDLEITVKDTIDFIKTVEDELNYINHEITKLYSLKMPAFKGVTFPDSSYFDVYNGLYVMLFGRYQLLMDCIKIADMVTKTD